MSLLVAEGYDDADSSAGLGTTPYLNKVYPSGAVMANYNRYWGRAAGRYTGFAKQFDSSNNSRAHYTLAASTPDSYVALAVRRDANSTTRTRIAGYTDTASSSQVIITMEGGSNGEDLVVYRGVFSATLATVTAVFPLNTWVWLSIRVKVANSPNGIVEIYDADGNVVLNLTGVDTQANASDTMDQIYHVGTGCDFSLDDVLIMDPTDSPSGTPFSGHLTERAIWTGFPTADGATLDWTANGAANRWDCVDEVVADDDTTYLSTATPGDINLSEFDATPSGMAGIEAVITQHRSRKDDGAARSVRSLLRRNAANNAGATNTLGASFVNYQDKTYEVDPATGLAWVASDIDSCELGIEAVS